MNKDILKVGDQAQIIPGSTFLNDKKINEDILKLTIYIRNINNDICTIARAKKGPVLGDISINNLKKIEKNENPNFKEYVFQIKENNVPLFNSFSKTSGIITRLKHFDLFIITNEKNGFGKIKNSAGWIELNKGIKLT